MDEEKKEKKQIPWLDEQTITIPVRKFRKMERKMMDMQNTIHDNQLTKYSLRKQIEEKDDIIAEYKKQIQHLLGMDEAEKDRLADMQFEKGVTADAES